MSEHAAEHHEHHWETSVWPLLVGLGVLLVPITFAFFFVYDNAGLGNILFAVTTLILVVACAGWTKEAVNEKEWGFSPGAMPFFIVAEAFIFVAFFAAYWTNRIFADVWPPEGMPHMDMKIPVIMTVILVSSSFTAHFAEEKLHNDDMGGFKGYVIATMVLGVIFAGLSATEWSHLIGSGFVTSTNIYASSFYSITGFHASHVFVGLAFWLAMLVPAMGGKVNKSAVACASMYWHFVDIVWFFVVSQIYFW